MRAGARFLGAPLAVPFKVAPTDWSPSTIAECSTPTHGYYRRSFPQTVGRWHSDRSGLVSSSRVPPSGCSPSSTRRLSRRFPVYLLTEVCVRLQHTFDKSPDRRLLYSPGHRRSSRFEVSQSLHSPLKSGENGGELLPPDQPPV